MIWRNFFIKRSKADEQKRDHPSPLSNPVDSNRLLDSLMASQVDFVWLTDLNGNYLRCNPIFEQLLGLPEKDIIGKTPYDFFTPEQAANLLALYHSVISTSQSQTGHASLTINGSNEEKRFKINKTPIFNHQDKLVAILSMAYDITQFNYTAAFLTNANSILEHITRDEPLTNTLREIINSIEAANPKMHCAIMILDADQKHLHHGYAARLPEAYCQSVDGIAIGPNVGSCGTAAFTGKPVVVNNIATDPLWQNFAQLAAQFSLKACWSSPIFSSKNHVIGTFAVYYLEDNCKTSEQDQTIVKHYSNLASVAIEHWQSQDKLETHTAKFQRLIERAPIPLAYVSNNGDIIFINKRFSQCYGYTLEDFKTLDEWWPIAYPDRDYREQVIRIWNAEMAKAIADNILDIAPLEYAITCKNGDVRISEVFGIILEDGFMATFVDLTKYKNAEKTIKNSENQLRSILINANAGIAVMDGQGNFQEVNDSFAALLALNAEQLVGKNCVEFSHPDDHAIIEQHFQELHNNIRNGYRMERRFVRLSGECTWVDLSVNSIRDEQGNLQNLVAMAVDINERKLAEHQAQTQMVELRRWHQAMLGRESRVMELKNEVNQLLKDQGLNVRYNDAT